MLSTLDDILEALKERQILQASGSTQIFNAYPKPTSTTPELYLDDQDLDLLSNIDSIREIHYIEGAIGESHHMRIRLSSR